MRILRQHPEAACMKFVKKVWYLSIFVPRFWFNATFFGCAVRTHVFVESLNFFSILTNDWLCRLIEENLYSLCCVSVCVVDGRLLLCVLNAVLDTHTHNVNVYVCVTLTVIFSNSASIWHLHTDHTDILICKVSDLFSNPPPGQVSTLMLGLLGGQTPCPSFWHIFVLVIQHVRLSFG
jgi:hypothetical protein